MSLVEDNSLPSKKWNTAFSEGVLSGLLALGDAFIVILSGVAAYWVYVGWSSGNAQIYAIATLLNVVLTVGVFHISGLYNFNMITSPYKQIHKVVIICGVVFMVLILMAFSIKVSSDFSRVWSFSSFIVEVLLICALRGYFFYTIEKLARQGRLIRRLAIIGSGDQAASFSRALEEKMKKNPWIRVAGIFDDSGDRSSEYTGPYPFIGDLEELIRRARDGQIDDIMLALPWSAEDRIMAIMGRMSVLPVNIHLCPDIIGLKFPSNKYSSIGGINCLNVLDKPISNWNFLFKKLEDFIFSSLIIVLILPLLTAIAVAIKLESRGPVLFRQKRYGFNNKIFEIYKFRSMYDGRPPEKGVPQATRDDPRVTKVGKFLRATSLDELPQLFNVLRGTMSLVGPRPHAVEHNEEYAEIIMGYFARHRVRPGITGWAQVNGLRGETETPGKMEARVKHDVEYIENWTLFLDIKILFMTAFVVFGQKTAY